MTPETDTKRRGRPPLERGKERDAMLSFRLSAAEKQEIEQAAEKAGKSVSTLLLEAWRASRRTGRAWERCSTPGCRKRATVKGLCRTCYAREVKRAERTQARHEQSGHDDDNSR